MALSEAEALQIVKDAIAANGGEVEHGKLVEDLEATGKGRAAEFIRNFKQRRLLTASMKAQPQGRPVLTYRDPNAPAPVGGE
ncbi:MAG: hypothetical protein AAF787_18365 [Chloroflexota bacterium]